MIIKSLDNNKILDTDEFTSEFFYIFKEDILSILLKFFQEIENQNDSQFL